MLLTTLLLTLKLMSVYIEPEDMTAKEDQALATCVADAMTERPSALVIATSKEAADATFVIGNHSGAKVRSRGRIIRSDGTVLVDVERTQSVFNMKQGFCQRANALIEEMAKKLNAKKAS